MQYQFKIQIKGITKPPVWRRITVPDDFSFYDFHLAIQAAFGWENYHLFMFSPKGYGSHMNITLRDDDFFEEGESLDAEEVLLSQIFRKEQQKFMYIYDFGDDWLHTIVLEKIFSGKLMFPLLNAGKGKCPPEDCGGVWGYENLKNTLSDPGHPEYAETAERMGLEPGETWDAKAFDLDQQRKVLLSVFSDEEL